MSPARELELSAVRVAIESVLVVTQSDLQKYLEMCTPIPAFFATPRIRLTLFSSIGFFSLFYLLTLSNNYSVDNLMANGMESVIENPSVMIKDRSFCCLTSDGRKDICGRDNCTWPCPDPSPSIPQLDDRETYPSNDGNTGFFVETSGRGVLNIRQACAVESLAFQNPNLTVFVLFIDTAINASSNIAIQLANQYENIH